MELWKLKAEELLAFPDVGLIPWIPLTQFEGEPEPLLRQCRERIDREGGPQKEQLLVVSQVLARLRFPQPNFLEIFGGRKVMIESPLIQEIADELKQQTRQETVQGKILRLLQVRLGASPEELTAELREVTNEERLDQLFDFAVACPTVEAFLERLRAEKRRPAPKPKGKPRSRKS